MLSMDVGVSANSVADVVAVVAVIFIFACKQQLLQAIYSLGDPEWNRFSVLQRQ